LIYINAAKTGVWQKRISTAVLGSLSIPARIGVLIFPEGF